MLSKEEVFKFLFSDYGALAYFEESSDGVLKCSFLLP